MKRTALFILILLPMLAFRYPGGAPAFSAWEKEEAAQVTLFLAGNPDDHSDFCARVMRDLRNIRERFGKEPISEDNRFDQPRTLNDIRFQPPWEPHKLQVRFNDATWAEVQGSRYTGWSLLNRQCDLDEIHLLPEVKGAQLTFSGELSPLELAAKYAQLSGVVSAFPQQRAGASSAVYPVLEADGKITWLFDKAWEDCQLHCRLHEYFYFETLPDGKINYIGYWDQAETRFMPDWWRKATANIELYSGN